MRSGTSTFIGRGSEQERYPPWGHFLKTNILVTGRGNAVASSKIGASGWLRVEHMNELFYFFVDDDLQQRLLVPCIYKCRYAKEGDYRANKRREWQMARLIRLLTCMFGLRCPRVVDDGLERHWEGMLAARGRVPGCPRMSDRWGQQPGEAAPAAI
ncbi:hypothetical protein K491DRAFT_471608 [Lophiostoma macrostomum CBS 122681]|uniref:Uncharacterized protein n=1 Tax=Lophiostoma macrostomum CBS 122681 TaxID=1314788 RepID=A0A6A6T557_9PLEO|nr:hypothetical protein K491DRAFT_471608 [Lophiostoma macrostomum CBS 122681]